MLILSRKPGQQIKIGATLLTLLKINGDSVNIRYGDYDFGLKYFETDKIDSDISLSVKPSTTGTVKIGIEAPDHIRIVRTELINRSPRRAHR